MLNLLKIYKRTKSRVRRFLWSEGERFAIVWAAATTAMFSQILHSMIVVPMATWQLEVRFICYQLQAYRTLLVLHHTGNECFPSFLVLLMSLPCICTLNLNKHRCRSLGSKFVYAWATYLSDKNDSSKEPIYIGYTVSSKAALLCNSYRSCSYYFCGP